MFEQPHYIEAENLSDALRGLRQRLSETHAAMARRLGVSLRTYDRWEAGETTPRGDVLFRIMDLCPDSETRSRFRSAATPEASGNFPATPRRHNATDRLRVRFRNSCLEAIRIIYESAVLGSTAADEMLAHYADELNRNATVLARELLKHQTAEH